MEITKFWTKTKIILLISFVVLIGLIIGIIFLYRANLKKEYIKLESQINNNASNFFLLEDMSLKKNEYKKININAIKKDNLISNKRINECKGYVIAENNTDDTDSSPKIYDYKTYLKCKKIYTTVGYGKTITSKKENKTKSQTEKDTVKPVITLLGSKTETISVGDTFKDPGASALDNVDGDLTKKIKTSGKVDNNTAGTYTIKYTVSDKAGNESTKSRKVIVKAEKVTTPKKKKDTIVPVITFKNTSAYQNVCIGDRVDISKDGVYGYTAHDDTDGDITSNVKITGTTTKVTKVGEYELKYTVKDKAGNKSVSTRKYSGIKCEVKKETKTNTNPNPTPSTPSTPNTPSTPSTPTPSTPTPSTPTPSTPSTPSTPTPSTPPVNVTTEPTGIIVQDNLYLSVGETQPLNASVQPSNATNKSLSYYSLNSGIASVDSNGNVRGNRAGSTRIRILTSNNIEKAVYVEVE